MRLKLVALTLLAVRNRVFREAVEYGIQLVIVELNGPIGLPVQFIQLHDSIVAEILDS